MGYETRYELEIEGCAGDPSLIIQRLREACDDAEYCLDADGESNDSGKWYDHDKDLTEFSKLYPHCVFTLSGVGEEPDRYSSSGETDIWKLYVKDGHSHRSRVKLIYEPCPFTPSLPAKDSLDSVRFVALSKLTKEEREALGL